MDRYNLCEFTTIKIVFSQEKSIKKERKTKTENEQFKARRQGVFR